jgi:hypothetical protein
MSKKTGNAALNTEGGVVDTKAEADAFFDVEAAEEPQDLGEVVESGEPFLEPTVETQTSEIEDETPKPKYNKVPNLSFGRATDVLRSGLRVTRSAWSGQTIQLQQPDANSLNTLPYFILGTVSGGKCPWSPTHEDLLAVDWIVVEE